jgi:hypothetical protein
LVGVGRVRVFQLALFSGVLAAQGSFGLRSRLTSARSSSSSGRAVSGAVSRVLMTGAVGER